MIWIALPVAIALVAVAAVLSIPRARERCGKKRPPRRKALSRSRVRVESKDRAPDEEARRGLEEPPAKVAARELPVELRAVERRPSRLDEDDVATFVDDVLMAELDTTLWLEFEGHAFLQEGDLGAARVAYVATWEKRFLLLERVPEERAVEVLQLLGRLHLVLVEQWPDEAIARITEVVRVLRTRLGKKHVLVSEPLRHLGRAFERCGAPRQAAKAFLEAVRVLEDGPGVALPAVLEELRALYKRQYGAVELCPSTPGSSGARVLHGSNEATRR